jgi:hypothetical protein
MFGTKFKPRGWFPRMLENPSTPCPVKSDAPLNPPSGPPFAAPGRILIGESQAKGRARVIHISHILVLSQPELLRSRVRFALFDRFGRREGERGGR